MNPTMIKTSVPKRPGRFAFALACTALAALSTLALAGGGDDDPTPPPGSGGGGPGGGLFFDDEMVGTLPMLGGGFDLLPPGASLPDSRPSFFVAGPTERVLRALVEAGGSGQVSLQSLGDGRSALLFHGAIHVELDATLFLDGEVQAGLVIGAELGHVAAGMFYEGRHVSTAVIQPLGRLAVPIGALYEGGVLKSGAHLYTANVFGDRDHYRLRAYAGIVSIDRMN